MMQYMQHRAKQTNIAPHELTAMRNTELSSDAKPSDKMRKFTLCLMVKNDWMDKEANLNKEVLLAMMPEEEKAKAEEQMKECEQTKGATPSTMHPYPDRTNKNASLSSVLISYYKKNFPSFVSI